MRWALAALAACGSSGDTIDPPPPVGPDGLIVHLALDDDPSDGVIDAEFGFPGRCERCPGRVAGQLGDGYLFDGTAEIIVVDAPPA